MFYKLKDHFRRGIFRRRVAFLTQTRPLVLSDDHGPMVLSQLQHKDVLMYLAAIKSFARRVPISRVQVIDDGSLTAEDRQLLDRHIPGMRFLSLSDCRDPRLPVGGTWERLIAIARLSETGYVIQLDADTLSIGPLDEVGKAWSENRSFTIGTWNGQTVEAVETSARRARSALNRTTPHVQMLAEAHLDQLERASILRYVRGCSGFAGFARGTGKLDLMYEFSSQMQKLLGNTWSNWGSEQVTSNFLVANQPDALVLPHPDYTDCEKMQMERTRFVHFIGTCRFNGHRYANLILTQDWN